MEGLTSYREGVGVAVRRGQTGLRHLVRNCRVKAGLPPLPPPLLPLLDHPDCQVVEQVVALGCQLIGVQEVRVQAVSLLVVGRGGRRGRAGVGVERLGLQDRRHRVDRQAGQHLPSLAHNLPSLARLH